MSFTPVAGKYGRVKIGPTNLEWTGEWTLSRQPTLIDLTTFETPVDGNGVCLVQKGSALTEITGTVKGWFNVDQSPTTSGIIPGQDGTISLTLLIRRTGSIGYVATVVIAGDEMSQNVQSFAPFSFNFHVNAIALTGV